MANEEDQSADLEVSDEDAERLLEDGSGDDSADDADSDQGDPDQLGDPGRRALNKLREERKSARAERDRFKNELAQLRAKLAEHEDKGKSELQRLQEAAQSGMTRAEKAEAALRRREIAEERAPAHATLAQIKAVAKRLTGGTDDELYDDADELFELLVPAPPKPAPSRTTRRPEERLQRPRGGVDPEEDDDTPSDPRALAEFIRSRGSR